MGRANCAQLIRSYPATPDSVPEARRDLTSLALTAGVAQERLDAIRLAVSEALTNAVLHAYPDAAGAVHVTAAVASGELWILISDDGCGLESRTRRPGLGLGLALIAQASDDFTVGPRSSGGVELRMRFDLAAPAAGQSRGSIASASRPASSRFSTAR